MILDLYLCTQSLRKFLFVPTGIDVFDLDYCPEFDNDLEAYNVECIMRGVNFHGGEAPFDLNPEQWDNVLIQIERFGFAGLRFVDDGIY